MGGSPGTIGSGKLAQEQEGGKREFGEAFLTTVSAAICHVAPTLTTILMFSSPSASRFWASQLRSYRKSHALSSEPLRFGSSCGLKEEAGPGVRP